MLLRRVTLFRFFGYKIKADSSWIFLSVLICWTLSNNVYPKVYPGLSLDTYQLMSVAALGGIIFSIIAHEVAHAVIAEYYHMPIDNITLFIFGGVAEMKGEPSNPRGEFLMAISGPIMSALLGLIFVSSADMYEIHIGKAPVSYVFHDLGRLNFFIAAFNLIPAFPLDGGRALRAIIWHKKNNLVLATRFSSETGKLFGSLLIAFACYQIYFLDDLLSGVWSALIGLFVHSAASYAVQHTENRSLLSPETVARFINTQIVAVSPDLTLIDLVDNYIYKHYQRSFPVVDRGLLVGVVSLQAVLSLDRHKWHWLHVASVMEPPTSDTVIGPDANAADALDLLQKHGREMLLVAKDRKFIGVVTFRDLISYLSISRKVDHNRSVVTSR